MLIRKTLLALATVLVALAPTASPAQASTAIPPQLDPFYAPPSPLPAGAPGTIIRSRPVIAQALPLLPVPVRAWQVLYKSTLHTGGEVAVSGIVLVPLTSYAGARPIVSYTTGTAGINALCATSYQLANGIEYETAIFGLALAKGWSVAITDYIGRGAGPGPQHYIVGPEAAHATIDMARAAQRLPDSGLTSASKVGFWGYSEGGHAAAWSAELAGTYAPELNVAGTAAGGVPGDIYGVARYMDGTPFSGIMMLAAIGISEAGYDVPFNEMLNPAGQAAAAWAKANCVELTTGFLAFQKLGNFTTVPDPMGMPQWRTALAAVSAGHYAPKAPLYMYHGTLDELIPYSNARALRAKYCSKGANVTWNTMWFVGHIGGVPVGAPGALSFLDDRFKGRSVSGNC